MADHEFGAEAQRQFDVSPDAVAEFVEAVARVAERWLAQSPEADFEITRRGQSLDASFTRSGRRGSLKVATRRVAAGARVAVDWNLVYPGEEYKRVIVKCGGNRMALAKELAGTIDGFFASVSSEAGAAQIIPSGKNTVAVRAPTCDGLCA